MLKLALDEGTKFRFRAHFALGQIAMDEGNPDEAIEQLLKAKSLAPRAAVSFRPGGASVYYLLAELYKKQGDRESAVKQMEELSAHSPEDYQCRLAIAEHYLAGVADDENAARKVFDLSLIHI